jgi:hypothetical protein
MVSVPRPGAEIGSGVNAEPTKQKALRLLARLAGVPPRGLETPANSPQNSTNPAPGGAKSGALDAKTPAIDPGLAVIIDAWPKVPEAIRAGILALVRAAGG